ncbi:MAG: hypothetical protein FWH33_09950 [Oscillospiraceae bacterium]|nr:hypothetical protein [Oscillospiraceae bacterium]
MLFDKNIEPSCAYCHHGTALGHDEYACIKNGLMSGAGSCKSFRYEPTRRVPQALPRFVSHEMNDEDFNV